MVDLGFLLITFFIFTTTMSSPTAMKLFMPKDADKPEDQNKAKESGALTILLGKDNNVFYYEGILDPTGANFKSSNFKDIRDVIINKKKNTNSEDFVIVIKPSDECKYKNVIDIMDEMPINEVKRYALVDIAEGEDQLIKASEASNGQ
jgi:biopolymer transport protein ExbD